MSSNDSKAYHVFLFHPDADTLTVKSVNSPTQVADAVSKYAKIFPHESRELIEMHVVQGSEVKLSIKSNAVVVEVGVEKFLPNEE